MSKVSRAIFLTKLIAFETLKGSTFVGPFLLQTFNSYRSDIEAPKQTLDGTPQSSSSGGFPLRIPDPAHKELIEVH